MMRWLFRSVFALLILLSLALGAGYVALRGSLPSLDGDAAAAGLTADAVIERDALGAVTITAANRDDVAYATGYAHAQDRYFQMDLARRMSAGRLAELVGDGALDFDARHRLHRFESTAHAVFVSLDVSQRTLLEAYARGVNAGLASLRVRPPEYLLLRQAPQPWRAEDCLLVVFTMYLQLNEAEGRTDQQRGLLASVLPPALVQYIYTQAPQWEAPIAGTPRAAAPMPGADVVDLRQHAADFQRLASLTTLAPTQRENSAVGSNSWAVDGTHTRTRAALLANDMHLGLGVPNTWYRARLLVAGATAAARRDLMGITLPGAPLMVVGSNGHVAWGFTNSYGDWTDLVRVHVSPDGTRYLARSGWRPLEHIPEVLRSSSGATRRIEVEQTEFGPLLPDSHAASAGAARAGAASGVPSGAGSDQRLAIAWTAHQPAATNMNWLVLETARTCAEALGIANTIGGPAQNFVCADAAGHVGWTILGRIPQRGAGYDPLVPSDWTVADAGWQGWVDPANYPRVLDPPGGLVWTANNRVSDDDAALRVIGDGSPDRGARAQQIRDDLRALPAGHAAEDDMLRIQLDDRAVYLAHWRDLLLQTLDASAVTGHPQRAAMRTLAGRWDARADLGSVGYRLVHEFHETLERRIFDALIVGARVAHPDEAFQVPRSFEWAAWELATQQPAHLLDPRFADWRAFLLDTVDASLHDVIADCHDATLVSCRWGDVNATRIQHPLSRAVPALARWLDMPREPMGGDHDMPHVHAPGFGASERFAVSPGHEAEGFFHMPGGQSGHPLSPYYRAGHEAWVRGTPLPYLPGHAQHTLTLRRAP